jgi:hypothetical protein
MQKREDGRVNTTSKLLQIYSPPEGGSASRIESRGRAAELQALDREKRVAAREEMTSKALEPRERIRMWERLYEASMPRRANHAALAIIAASTGLTMEELREEQRRRRSTPSHRVG